MAFHATGASCYLKADLFYLEVVLLPCGEVEDVKMAWHGRSPVVCKCIICGMKFAAQVIIRDSVAAKRMAAAAPQVRGLLTAPRSATSNSYQLPVLFFFFTSLKGEKLLSVLREVGKPVQPVQHPGRKVPNIPAAFKPLTRLSIFDSFIYLISGRSGSKCLNLCSTFHRTCGKCPVCPGEVKDLDQMI